MSDEQALDHVHELHGQSLLRARGVDTEEERRGLLVEAQAYHRVISIFEDDWKPFDDGPMRAEFRAVSEAVLSADRTRHTQTDDEPRLGLE